MSKYYHAQLSHQLKDPSTAAMLSLVPGLGHIYEGQRRKGLLFLGVTSINVLLFFVIALNDQMLAHFTAINNAYHIQANDQLINALKQVSFGSTVSIMFAGLVLSFLAYAIQDAYDQAALLKRKSLYADEMIELPEATSSSYIIHFALMASCFVLAMFFLVPPKPHQQVTEIVFIQNPERERPVKPKSRIHATTSSKPAGKHNPNETPELSKPHARQLPLPAKPIAQSSNPTPATPQLFSPRLAANPPAPKSSATILKTATVPLPAMAPAIRIAGLPSLTPKQYISAGQPVPAAQRGTQATGTSPQATQVNLSHGTSGISMPISKSNFGSHNSEIAPSTQPIASGSGMTLGQPMPKADFGTNSVSQTAAPKPIRSQNGTGISGLHSISPSIPRPNSPAGGSTEGNSDTNHAASDRTSPAITQNADFGPYMDELQRRIKRCWFPPKDMATKRVVVNFKILSDGTLSHLRLEKSSGVAIADQAALTAVQNAQPFRHLPKYAPNDVDIQFTFDYNVFGLQRR